MTPELKLALQALGLVITAFGVFLMYYSVRRSMREVYEEEANLVDESEEDATP